MFLRYLYAKDMMIFALWLLFLLNKIGQIKNNLFIMGRQITRWNKGYNLFLFLFFYPKLIRTQVKEKEKFCFFLIYGLLLRPILLSAFFVSPFSVFSFVTNIPPL